MRKEINYRLLLVVFLLVQFLILIQHFDRLKSLYGMSDRAKIRQTIEIASQTIRHLNRRNVLLFPQKLSGYHLTPDGVYYGPPIYAILDHTRNYFAGDLHLPPSMVNKNPFNFDNGVETIANSIRDLGIGNLIISRSFVYSINSKQFETFSTFINQFAATTEVLPGGNYYVGLKEFQTQKGQGKTYTLGDLFVVGPYHKGPLRFVAPCSSVGRFLAFSELKFTAKVIGGYSCEVQFDSRF